MLIFSYTRTPTAVDTSNTLRIDEKNLDKQDRKPRSQNLLALRKEGHKKHFLKCHSSFWGEQNYNMGIVCITMPQASGTLYISEYNPPTI